MPSSLSVERKVTFLRHCSVCGHVWFYERVFFESQLDSYIESDESIYRKMEKKINSNVDEVSVRSEIICPKCSNLAIETVDALFSSGYKSEMRRVWIETMRSTLTKSYGESLISKSSVSTSMIPYLYYSFTFLMMSVSGFIAAYFTDYKMAFYGLGFASIAIAILCGWEVLLFVRIRKSNLGILDWIDSIDEREALDVVLEIVKRSSNSLGTDFSIGIDLLSIYERKQKLPT